MNVRLPTGRQTVIDSMHPEFAELASAHMYILEITQLRHVFYITILHNLKALGRQTSGLMQVFVGLFTMFVIAYTESL